jgi:hypothetical protein
LTAAFHIGVLVVKRKLIKQKERKEDSKDVRAAEIIINAVSSHTGHLYI